MKCFETFEDFANYTGLMRAEDIENDRSFMSLTLSSGIKFSEDGRFETEDVRKLHTLVSTLNMKPGNNYHIITMVDTDDGNIAYDNKTRIVNRVGYFVGNGRRDEAVFELIKE